MRPLVFPFLVANAAGVKVAHDDVKLQFDEYVGRHRRDYQPGSREHDDRFALFRRRVQEIEAHNRRPGRTWQAGVNKLTDRTDAELASLRGYVHQGRDEDGAPSARGVEFLGRSSRSFDMKNLPTSHSWRHLKAMSDVNDQRECGSCWAFATTTVLRAHSELYQQDRTFSVQQVVSCTPNPRGCGGDGGCGGATSELAMDYVQRMGVHTAEKLAYRGSDDKCPDDMMVPKPTLVSTLAETLNLNLASMPQGAGTPSAFGGGASFGMRSWRKLPENQLEPLMLAVYEQGPVAVSLSADAKWNMYRDGILAMCAPDAVINHAVVLYGFGEMDAVSYWEIQNSWGPDWGERGHLRLQRKTGEEEGEYCGWDMQPEVGTACRGGPSKVWVCGSCGILYDSVVPDFDLSPHGLLARSRPAHVGGQTPFAAHLLQLNSSRT